MLGAIVSEWEANILARSLAVFDPTVTLTPTTGKSLDVRHAQGCGSLHVVRVEQKPADSAGAAAWLIEAAAHISDASRRMPHGRHLVWLQVTPAASGEPASGSDIVVLCAGLLGALAHLCRSAFIGGVVDTGDRLAGADIAASLLLGRLPLPSGSLIAAEAWNAAAQPHTPPPQGCSGWRFVAAAGSQMPLLEAADARALLRWREEAADASAAQLFGGDRIDRATLDPAGDDGIADLLLRCGLAEASDGQLTTALRWSSHDGLQVLSDPDIPDALQGPAYLDPLWEAPILCRLFPDHAVQHALDVGCGAGLTTLRLAALARNVLAIDINPRALTFTRANCTLNCVANVELAQGDLLEPAGGRQSDAVVFNSPTDREERGESLLLSGASILDRFFLTLPSILAPSGWCLINLAYDERRFAPVLERAAASFGAEGARRDFAFVERTARRGDEHWRRGLLLIAPGSGRGIACVIDYAAAARPLRLSAPLSITAWLQAIREVVP